MKNDFKEFYETRMKKLEYLNYEGFIPTESRDIARDYMEKLRLFEEILSASLESDDETRKILALLISTGMQVQLAHNTFLYLQIQERIGKILKALKNFHER